MTRTTVRLTMAQALVRYLCNQFTEIDGDAGAALRRRLRHLRPRQRHLPQPRRWRRCRTRCRPGAARTSSRWRWPPSASPRPSGAGRSWSPPPRSGRARPTWSPPPALAHSNRLPVLLLAGDTFANRRPDPVMQQVEHFGNPTVTVNDAFRAVTPLLGPDHAARADHRLAAAGGRGDARPGRLRPGLPRALPGHPGDRLRLPGGLLRADASGRSRARAPTATGWPRRWRCSRPRRSR